MGNSLEHLLAEGVISEIITRLKSGKEADVYAVRQGGKVIAAKVYKDRAHRSFKNNADYKEGRSVRNSRSQRAMDRGSKFGKEAAEDAWKATEANTLYKLHAAGVRVPTPVMFLEGVLFMELVLGPDGQAAPRLIDSDLSVEDAHGAYLDMLTQLVRILSCDLIHGDLSPYNVLWAATGPTIIDFPQCVSASHSSHSENFFLRDARNILGHFAAIDPRLRSRSSDAFEIWRAYTRRELSPDFVPTGRPSRPEPRFNEPRAADHRGPPQQAGHRGPPQQAGHRGPPQQAGHRGPSQQLTANPQQRNPAGPRDPSGPRNPSGPRGSLGPPQNTSHSQGSERNAPPARKAFASAPKSHPAPGLSRGGPRRPDVIVLTRRSPKPSGAPPTEQRAANPPDSANSNPRFSPNPRSDANPTPRFNSNPRSETDPRPRFSPNPRPDSNPGPGSRFSPNANANQRPNPNANRNPGPNPSVAAGVADEGSSTRRKRRRRRRPSEN